MKCGVKYMLMYTTVKSQKLKLNVFRTGKLEYNTYIKIYSVERSLEFSQ
jgi:hypothetical protein